MYTVLIFYLAAFPLQVLQDNLDVLQCDSDLFSMYGTEVRWYLFLVSALHHRYCFLLVPCSFFTMYTVRQFGCPLVRQSHTWHVCCKDDVVPISSVFSLCFFTIDSVRSNTLSHSCFPFLPSSSSSMLYDMPIFINLFSCSSHPGLCSDKFVVLRVFTFQAAPVFHSLDLLLLTCFIHINHICLSLPAASTSPSVSSLSWTCGLWGFYTCVIHSFILIYLHSSCGFCRITPG